MMTGPSPKHSVNKIPSLNVGRDNIQHGANLRHLIKDKTFISDNYGLHVTYIIFILIHDQCLH